MVEPTYETFLSAAEMIAVGGPLRCGALATSAPTNYIVAVILEV